MNIDLVSTLSAVRMVLGVVVEDVHVGVDLHVEDH